MDKKIYYVSVQGESVHASQGDSAYEFEIEADEQDVEKLMKLFGDLHDADQSTALRAHIPILEYHHDPQNDRYDVHLQDIYRKIHELGTEETKQHIEQMDVLHNRPE